MKEAHETYQSTAELRQAWQNGSASRDTCCQPSAVALIQDQGST